jgi:uncharacterized repeat protein (TIGR01451 family)
MTAGTLAIVNLAAVPVQAQSTAAVPAVNIYNQASYSYSTSGLPYSGQTNDLNVTASRLADPLGQIVGCDGNQLPDYKGFSLGVYEPDASGLELGNLVALTRTELPDIPGNGISAGLNPNSQNSNPFFLTNSDQGRYNFLLDPGIALRSAINAGLTQTDAGAQYILVVNPPSNSIYNERRIRLEILTSTTDPATNRVILSYRATALDGQPISLDGNTQVTDTLEVQDAELQGLSLFSLSLETNLCETEQLSITKTANQASAQPGDTVVYRLAIRNLVNIDLTTVVATDTLPPGFQLVPDAVFGQINGQSVAINTQVNGSEVIFSTPVALPPDQVLDIVYGVLISPDALRGSAENIVYANAERSDNGFRIQDGPGIYRLLIDPGILTDCATLIGRVFVDKNFDGEQQPGEPGVPNAVIFLDDGNRIVTDADGLYSVSCMLPGYRTGVLDFSSLPGYALAPNLYFNERNSQSRLVQLAPGGMMRMNFGVTPTFQEEAQ